MNGGENMEGYIQIGTAALRAPNGEFLPSQPIFREIETQQPMKKSYIDEDELFDIFADKCLNYITFCELLFFAK